MRLAPLVLACLAPSVAADLLVVDSAGGGGFTSIESAVQAAGDGDVILVKPGVYGGFYVQDKALTIVSEQDHQVLVNGASRVALLSAGKTVTIQGLRFRGIKGAQYPYFAGYGFLAFGNAGALRFEDCSFEGANWDTVSCSSSPAPSGWDALVLDQCASVAVTGSIARGGKGAGFSVMDWCWPADAGHGATGIRIAQSSVVLDSSEVRGGDGGAGVISGAAGPGIRFLGGDLVIASSTVRGGNGKFHIDAFGIGVDGTPGVGIAADGPWIEQGAAIEGGTVPWMAAPWQGFAPSSWPVHFRVLWASPVAAAGHSITVSSIGVAGDAVLLLLGLGSAHVPLPVHGGVLLIAPFDILPIGTIASASFALGVRVGPLPPGFASTIALQAAHVPLTGPIVLTALRHVTVHSAQ